MSPKKLTKRHFASAHCCGDKRHVGVGRSRRFRVGRRQKLRRVLIGDCQRGCHSDIESCLSRRWFAGGRIRFRVPRFRTAPLGVKVSPCPVERQKKPAMRYLCIAGWAWPPPQRQTYCTPIISRRSARGSEQSIDGEEKSSSRIRCKHRRECSST